MFLKCLNNSIYLWHLYVLTWINTWNDIYKNFSLLSTVQFRRNRILNMSITKSVGQPNTYTAYQLLITTTIIMKTTKDES